MNIMYFVNSGKTSLLFQYALSCATEGHEILFVCQSQEKLMDCVKVRSDLPCPSLLKNVHIRSVIINFMVL